MNDRALKVLEQYEMEILGTRRGRGSYIFETPEGLRILCDYQGTEKKAGFQNLVMEKIRDGGYERVDIILPNKEGNLVSKDWEENSYVVKEWYPGRECDTSSETEILAAVGNLARLHRLMTLAGEEELEQSFAAPDMEEKMRAQNAELKKIETFIRKKNNKSDFERELLNSFPLYIQQAREAEESLRGLWESRRAKKSGALFHGAYDYHHILMSGYEIATTNFESCRYGEQITDLYRFMRKILEKHDWNPRLGIRMLDHYGAIRPLSGEERRLLRILMQYPEKFRKLANRYYGSSKAWVSKRFTDKLEMIRRQQKQREAFLKKL